jgi:hypothetical protein
MYYLFLQICKRGVGNILNPPTKSFHDKVATLGYRRAGTVYLSSETPLPEALFLIDTVTRMAAAMIIENTIAIPASTKKILRGSPQVIFRLSSVHSWLTTSFASALSLS